MNSRESSNPSPVRNPRRGDEQPRAPARARTLVSACRSPERARAPARRRPHARRAQELSVDDYARGVLAADRAVLGRAISLIESTKPSDEATAQQVLTRLLSGTGRAMRIGITGMPGAGKSTFIERLGSMLTERGHRVAVLAIDPSSRVSGGSILGDRTRMGKLSSDPRAFIRPSPSGGTLGGIARKTREAMLVCEAAGFDIVLIETVGVGQSETAIADMSDVVVALAIPGAGDELQGIKRGLLELVDLIVVNKAEGENAAKARTAAAEYAAAARVMRGDDTHSAVSVLTCSALTGEGVWRVFEDVQSRFERAASIGRDRDAPTRPGSSLAPRSPARAAGSPAARPPRRQGRHDPGRGRCDRGANAARARG
jgi:LAO/AO transport system kinase